jgi:hypothetical protein
VGIVTGFRKLMLQDAPEPFNARVSRKTGGLREFCVGQSPRDAALEKVVRNIEMIINHDPAPWVGDPSVLRNLLLYGTATLKWPPVSDCGGILA